MRRRAFLKILGISPIIPSVLMAKPKYEFSGDHSGPSTSISANCPEEKYSIDATDPRGWDYAGVPVKQRRENSTINLDSIDSRQKYVLGTVLVTSNGFRYRYCRNSGNRKICAGDMNMWFWIPENPFIANPPQEYLERIRNEM